MNFPHQSFAPNGFRGTPPQLSWRDVFRRCRLALADAGRVYSEELVCRALAIEPEAREQMGVDVRFCDVR